VDARCVWETGEGRTVFWWGGMMERGHLEVLGVDGRILKLSLRNGMGEGGICNGLMYLRAGTGGRLLRMR